MYRQPLIGAKTQHLWRGDVFRVSDNPYDRAYIRTADVPPPPKETRSARRQPIHTAPLR
jgi:hypothetical protein